MRKWLIAAVFFSLSQLQFIHASQDRDGSMRPALWRSTEVCHGLNFVQLSTRAANIHHVRITSATVNIDSSYNLFNSTTRPIGDNAANFISTGTRLLTYVNVQSTGVAWTEHFQPYVADVYNSSGVTVNKVGTACVELLWDFSLPTYDPIYPWKP